MLIVKRVTMFIFHLLQIKCCKLQLATTLFTYFANILLVAETLHVDLLDILIAFFFVATRFVAFLTNGHKCVPSFITLTPSARTFDSNVIK